MIMNYFTFFSILSITNAQEVPNPACGDLTITAQTDYNTACGAIAGPQGCSDACYEAIPKIFSIQKCQEMIDSCKSTSTEAAGQLTIFEAMRADKLIVCGKALEYGIKITDLKFAQTTTTSVTVPAPTNKPPAVNNGISFAPMFLGIAGLMAIIVL
jgi:hypothetical protein